VSNRLSGELATEFSSAEKSLSEAAAAGERTGTARLINILSFFGSCESLSQDLTTVDGASIWAGDGIHLTSNASRVAARKLMADLAHGGQGGQEGEPAAKRTRLESVVPVPALAKKKEVAKSNPPPPPPRPCPPPLWLSGQLPPTPTQHGRGAGGQNPSSSYWGEGPAWDNQHGGNRGNQHGGNRGNQHAALRGGKRGRWGRW
jgi:hypothetical protein